MSIKVVCDHCQRILDKDYVKIEYKNNSRNIYRHYHIDCFNYKFSCDIRKINEVINEK